MDPYGFFDRVTTMGDMAGSWRELYSSSQLRDEEFETISGIPLAPVYGPGGPLSADDKGAETQGELPGEYPFTRGPHASMYRSKLWTMRMFAGFGTALDTNQRFLDILRSGGNGLSTAFDLPTLMGRDSDDPRSEGEVGKCGVAIDTIEDVGDLFNSIDLSKVTTSMTINSPAPVILAMFIQAAIERGIDPSHLGGTLQNDILKEYQAQKEYRFPPRPSMRLVVDTFSYCNREMPKWHPISISGYHIREAGSTAVQELAFTLANGFGYVEAGIASGMSVDSFAPSLSFFFNSHIDFFEEVAKFRAARRIWARWMTERYGAKDMRSTQLRFHTQTSGASLTAQQPEVNIVRTALQAMAGVMGGTQSLHTNSMDEVLALPTEKAARIALRTQQVIAFETGVANVADPLGGSYFVEALTDEVEKQAEEIFSYLDELGSGSILEGIYQAIDNGYFVGEIANAAYQLEKKISAGKRVVVGVNAFFDGNDSDKIPILTVSKEVEAEQKQRLAQVKSRRSSTEVDQTLEALKLAARDPLQNLMPSLISSVRARATVGEVMDALEEVFGAWSENLTI